MAWRSSELCKSFKSSLKRLHRSSYTVTGNFGDLDSSYTFAGRYGGLASSLSLISRSNFSHRCKSTASSSSRRTPSFNKILEPNFTKLRKEPWICRSLASGYDAYTTNYLTSLSAKPFSSASQSSSHRLEDIQELQEGENGGGEIVEHDILRTQDGPVLYAGMKSIELLSTLLNLHLVAYEPLVDLSIKMLQSPLMGYAVYRKPLLAMVKRTAFSHFCGGDGVGEASKTIQRLWELRWKSILDYSLEDAMDNSSCDRNLIGFLHTIDQTKQLPNGSVGFACVKMTALCPLPLLEKISSLLRWQHMHAGIKLPWREDVLPLLVEESPLYHVQSPPEPLTDEEERDVQFAKERLWKLCGKCDEASLPLLVDAEYTSVQPAIDYYTYIAASEFNKNEYPLVYGTIQAYLKDSLPRLALAATEAAKKRIIFGVKLVRGAYIRRESALAASLGAESPIHSCIEETHECFDTCAAYMMGRAVNGQGAVVVATHNFDSGRAAAVKAETLGLLKGNPLLQFAQLKGMADRLSLALVHAGFQVSKYLPFGPVEQAIPYLIRRADENRGFLGNALSDGIYIRQELKRRFFANLWV